MKNKKSVMRIASHFILIVTAVLLLCQCKTKNITTTDDQEDQVENFSVPFGSDHKIVLLDSMKAATEISTDKVDHFFNRVTNTEMAIQMKENRDCSDRSVCIEGYRNFLRKDVESFTTEEEERIAKVFSNISDMISKVNPAIIDRDILLIKTKGNHYGDGVYYTRENKIVIPQDQLNSFNEQQFTQTMLHEIFHIFSRYNKETRDALYQNIGFKPISGKLVLPQELSNRKLLNPDGTTDYQIKIGDDWAYPLLTASADGFETSKPRFFDYLQFNLYKLQKEENGNLIVSEVIPFQEAPDFFKQIKDNTDYIIHPDEIMADNFIYAINYVANGEKVKSFSEEGMKLLESVSTTLKEHQ